MRLKLSLDSQEALFVALTLLCYISLSVAFRCESCIA